LRVDDAHRSERRGEAQVAITGIQAFGDSYADIGNLFKIAHGIGQFPLYPTGRFSGSTIYVDTTSPLLGIPQLNFAIGSAKTDRIAVLGPTAGSLQEVQGLLGPIKIAPSDPVEINIGGNDARQYYQTGGTLAGVPVTAATSATNAINGTNALVSDGARNIVFAVGDVSKLPEATGNPNALVGSAYSQTCNNLMQIALASVADSGVRVEYVDTRLLGTLIQANPARYGFTETGACSLACIGNPALQNQFLFYVDGIHLTSHGFAVLGEYIVNRPNAPLTFAPQGDLATISAMGFASTLFGKLDLFREISGFASTMNAYAADMRAPYAKAPPLAPIAVNPWSFYMQGNGGVSDRQATVASNDFNLDSVGGTIGVEYRSVGVQFRAPFVVNGRIINPYLNLTADDDFIGNGRIIQFSATSAPLIVNNWAFPNGTSQNVYARVAAGVVAPVWTNVCSPPMSRRPLAARAAKISMARVGSRFGSSA
jgi:outer membrane lipase/esterase